MEADKYDLRPSPHIMHICQRVEIRVLTGLGPHSKGGEYTAMLTTLALEGMELLQSVDAHPQGSHWG